MQLFYVKDRVNVAVSPGSALLRVGNVRILRGRYAYYDRDAATAGIYFGPTYRTDAKEYRRMEYVPFAY